jgi:thymidylate synthase ThyX
MNEDQNVKLVWSTPEAEQMIVYMARVSAPKNQTNMDTAPRLLRYLIDHAHLSPFEMANMCVEINTTRAISAQSTKTRLYMNGTLRSWLTYIALREKHGTQMEHMLIAKQAKTVFSEQFPIITEAMGGLSQDWEF